MNPRGILVMRGGAVGDFVVTIPALRALRGRWPGAHVELACYPRVAELALAAGLADKTASLDRPQFARMFCPPPSCPTEADKRYIGSFDLVVCFLLDPDGALRRNLAAAGASTLVYASPAVSDMHAADHFLRPLERIGIRAPAGAAPRIELPPANVAAGRKRMSRLGARVLAIHPGSGSRKKNWPIRGFLRLARSLEDAVTPVFVIGEADQDAMSTLATVEPKPRVMSGLTLLELSENLAACCGYVGNDSGVTHLAAALGVPVAAIFGPTDPRVWGPRGARVRTVRASRRSGGALSSVSPASVRRALNGLLAG